MWLVLEDSFLQTLLWPLLQQENARNVSSTTNRKESEHVVLSGEKAAGWCVREWCPARYRHLSQPHQQQSQPERRCTRHHSADTHREEMLMNTVRWHVVFVCLSHSSSVRHVKREHGILKGVRDSPVWHDRCYLWRGRRRRSWQPQPAESWSSSSFQSLTAAQAPLHTSTSKLPSLGPVNTQPFVYSIWHWALDNTVKMELHQKHFSRFIQVYRHFTSPMVLLTYWSIALAISALFTPLRNFMLRTRGWCLSHQLSALSPARRVQWMRDCCPAPIPITCRKERRVKLCGSCRDAFLYHLPPLTCPSLA